MTSRPPLEESSPPHPNPDPALRRRRLWPFLALFVAFVVMATTGIILRSNRDLLSDGRAFTPEDEPWLDVAVSLPASAQPALPGATLRFEQRRGHPFLAEYDRRLIVTSSAAGELVFDLPYNAGGRTLVNLHWHEAAAGRGPWLTLREYWGLYALELGETPRLWYVCERDQRRFLAAERCHWSRTNDEPWQLGGPHEPLPFAGPGSYLGRIDGRTSNLVFVPAEQAPEEQLREFRQPASGG